MSKDLKLQAERIRKLAEDSELLEASLDRWEKLVDAGDPEALSYVPAKLEINAHPTAEQLQASLQDGE